MLPTWWPGPAPDVPTSPPLARRATLLSERLNGEGMVSQLELWSHDYIEPLLVATIAALVWAGVKPTNDFLRKAQASPAFGLQNVAGRVGFLGLAATLAAEMVTGKVRGRPCRGCAWAGSGKVLCVRTALPWCTH